MPPDTVGCIRNFHLRDGGDDPRAAAGALRLRLQCTYSILESPMGVDNYVATLKLTPVTDGDRTFAEWTRRVRLRRRSAKRELAEQIGAGRVPGRLRRAEAPSSRPLSATRP